MATQTADAARSLGVVSTRHLILLALITGMAILVAFAVQMALVL